MPPLDNGDAEKLARLKSTDIADLARGMSSVEGMTPEAEAAHDRRDNLYLKKTIRKGKQVAVWAAIIAFCLLMIALLITVLALIWVHIDSVVQDPQRVADLLEDAFGWIMIALSSLFIDRRLRGDK